jgi:hypothetical protein
VAAMMAAAVLGFRFFAVLTGWFVFKSHKEAQAAQKQSLMLRGLA